MAIKKTGGGAHPPLDARAADKLLDLLSTDNEFRRLFKKDPHAALARVGHSLPRETSLACMSVKHIAPKREIAAARDEIKSQLVSSGSYVNPHCFEAGKVTSNLRRR